MGAFHFTTLFNDPTFITHGSGDANLFTVSLEFVVMVRL